MILRLTVIALGLVVVLPALLGYAASFSISPVVSQELRVPVEDVDTEQVGGPEEVSGLTSLGSEPEVQRAAAPEPIADDTVAPELVEDAGGPELAAEELVVPEPTVEPEGEPAEAGPAEGDAAGE